MPLRGEPFDPDDPEGESTFQMSIDPKLLPKPDLSGGVQLADREGVFAHSFRCDHARFISSCSRGPRSGIAPNQCRAPNVATEGASFTASLTSAHHASSESTSAENPRSTTCGRSGFRR